MSAGRERAQAYIAAARDIITSISTEVIKRNNDVLTQEERDALAVVQLQVLVGIVDLLSEIEAKA